MTRIITVANQKGGVGKTTVTANLGAALTERGWRVLLVDLDPQGSLTLSLGLQPDDQEVTAYDVLTAAANGRPVPIERAFVTAGDLTLVPSNIGLSAADVELAGPLGAFALKDALETMPTGFDYVLVDCPPNLGVLTLSALLAATEVLIPLQADYLATRGLVLLTDQIRKVQRKVNPKLKLLGVVLTMADRRTRHTRDVEASIRTLGESGRLPVFKTVIPFTVKLKDAAASGQSILATDGKSQAAEAFRALAEEIDLS